MPAWISFISYWPNMSQWLSDRKKRKKEIRKRKTWRWRGRKKKSTFRDWCTTDVTTTQLGDKITEKCKEKEWGREESVSVCVCVYLVLEEKKNIVSATLVIFSILFIDTAVRSSSVCDHVLKLYHCWVLWILHLLLPKKCTANQPNRP